MRCSLAWVLNDEFEQKMIGITKFMGVSSKSMNAFFLLFLLNVGDVTQGVKNRALYLN